jgi:hypothetical protein
MSEPITKNDLNQALEEFETRILKAVFAAMAQQKDELIQRMDDIETRMLRGFSDFAFANGERLKKMETNISTLDTTSTARLGEIERQLNDYRIRLMTVESKVLHP